MDSDLPNRQRRPQPRLTVALPPDRRPAAPVLAAPVVAADPLDAVAVVGAQLAAGVVRVAAAAGRRPTTTTMTMVDGADSRGRRATPAL